MIPSLVTSPATDTLHGSGCVRAARRTRTSKWIGSPTFEARRDDDAADGLAQLEARTVGISDRYRTVLSIYVAYLSSSVVTVFSADTETSQHARSLPLSPIVDTGSCCLQRGSRSIVSCVMYPAFAPGSESFIKWWIAPLLIPGKVRAVFILKGRWNCRRQNQAQGFWRLPRKAPQCKTIGSRNRKDGIAL